MKKTLALILALLVALPLSGCGEPKYSRYRSSFLGTFDTMVEMVAYAATDKEFDRYAALLKTEFERYHQLFDKYNDYPGVNNIKTINDQAGIAPVVVDRAIVDLVLMSKDWAERSRGTVNVAMGPVLSIWHDYRELYQGGAPDPKLPPMANLQTASAHTDITKVVVDEEASTVFLPEAEMSLDVGAVAKGYATELAGHTLYEAGCRSLIISSGGNVRIFDAPLDGVRASWGVGIQDPQQDPTSQEQTYLDTIFTTDASIVTSGNYQRYYLVEGEKVHHIIDPATLLPANRYAAVTVVCENSGMADLLSTALFILDEEQGRELAEQNGAEAFWVYEDGTTAYTQGLLPLLKERGGATSLIPSKKES